MKKIPVIIDTDPGIDDAAAIVNAINSKELDIKLITTVFGNVDIEKTTNNALKLVEFLNREDIKVAKGASKAIFFKNIIDASEVHGKTGMDGYEFKNPLKKIEEKHAIEAMKEVIENTDEKITILTLGALTNVALLLTIYPSLSSKIKEIVSMGGSLTGGNTNTACEFNIYNDPHAAKIVFDFGVPIVLFGLDVTRKCMIKREGIEKLKNGTEVAKMCYSLFNNYRSEGIKKNGLMMHDSTTVAYLVKPELFKFKEMYIDVSTEGAAIGTLVSDYYTIRNLDKKENIKYAIDVDSEEFEKWIVESINKN